MPVSLAIKLSDCIDPLADLTVGTLKLTLLKISYVLLGALLAFFGASVVLLAAKFFLFPPKLIVEVFS
jgi:hypothetical protein